MMKKIVLATILLFTLMVNASFAYWLVTPNQGTTADYLINMTRVTVDYTSSANSKQGTADVIEYSAVTVDPIYGFDIDLPIISTFGIEPGESATYDFKILNASNIGYAATFSISTVDLYELGTEWTYMSSADVTLWPFESTTLSVIHMAGADASAYPGDYVTMNVKVRQTSINAGTGGGLPENRVYYGLDGNTIYAGFVTYNHLVKTWIQMPDIRVTKSAVVTIDDSGAPVIQNGKVIPGATIMYTIIFWNRGSDTANTTIITDILPTANTDFELGSTGNTVFSYVGGTVTFGYATTDNPEVFNYDPIKNGPYGLDYPPADSTVDARVNGIQFNVFDVPIDGRGTLNYSVIVQ